MTKYRIVISNNAVEETTRDCMGSRNRLSSAPQGSGKERECSNYATLMRMPRSSSSLSNARGHGFGAVHAAIDLMKELPESSDFYISPAVAGRASDLLGVLASNMDVDPPQIFPQERDLLVLKWVVGRVERFLSVSPDDFDLMDIHQGTRFRCAHELAEDGSLDLASLFSALSVPFSNVTAGNDIDA